MTTTIEEFYKKNAQNYFYCSILNARISLNQCKINQEKYPQCQSCIAHDKQEQKASQESLGKTKQKDVVTPKESAHKIQAPTKKNGKDREEKKTSKNITRPPKLIQDCNVLPDQVVMLRKSYVKFYIVFGVNLCKKYDIYNFKPVVFLYSKTKDEILVLIEEKQKNKRSHRNLQDFIFLPIDNKMYIEAPEKICMPFFSSKEPENIIRCSFDEQRRHIFLY